MINPGFRKFFSTALNPATKNAFMVETFLGHNTGHAGDYNKQTDEDKLELYESWMHALTISDEDHLKVKVQEQDKMIGAAAEILKYAREHDIKIGL